MNFKSVSVEGDSERSMNRISGVCSITDSCPRALRKHIKDIEKKCATLL
jgi:hypothetical protein